MAMYRAPRNEVFGPMIQTGKMSDRWPWLTQKFWPNIDRQGPGKIQRVLELVDAVLTKEDRQRLLRHQLSDSDAYRLVNRTVKSCKEISWTAFTLKAIKAGRTYAAQKAACPKHFKPTARAKTQVMGMANNLIGFDFAKFVPDYNHNGARRSNISLVQHYEDKLLPEMQEFVDEFHSADVI